MFVVIFRAKVRQLDEEYSRVAGRMRDLALAQFGCLEFHAVTEDGHNWLRVFLAGDAIQVDVKDNGIGILPEDHPRIFQRFFRGEDPLVLAVSGTGLGLAIVKHLVEMHHGRI